MRQAVILIHGIGEQRPMRTVRGFVAGVLGATEEGSRRVFSKPDRMSESFELRRLVAEKTRSRPMTDFYEYYWAYHMEGTKLRHLWPWFRTVLFRSPRTVPAGLRVLWTLSWVLAVGATFFLVKGRLFQQHTLWDSSSVVGFALAGFFSVVQGFAVNFLGDAARYLSPRPGNIAIRQKIRSEGIKLLRRLHSSGDYDRIVVVGHSLGSVIGYDVLTHLWSQLNTVYGKPDKPHQRSLAAVEQMGPQLSASSRSDLVEEFQKFQRELWIEQRGLGFPWLVTDFVTLGSPLAHGAILLATERKELITRQQQRELPTCPPVQDDNHYSYLERYQFGNAPRSMRVLHHAGVFASTRWSNVFFPIRFGLLGDWVGGELRPVFGPGIRDVPVTDGLMRFVPLLPHTYYWRGSKTPSRAGRMTALGALAEVLDLDCARWLPRLAPPTAVKTEAAAGTAAVDGLHADSNSEAGSSQRAKSETAQIKAKEIS
jgi:hypothetical protein